MTLSRACIALLLLGLIGLLVVQLQSARTLCAGRVQMHETRMIQLRREMWSVQMEAARLRTPEQIRERVQRMNLALQGGLEALDPPPRERPAAPGRSRSPARLASSGHD